MTTFADPTVSPAVHAPESQQPVSPPPSPVQRRAPRRRRGVFSALANLTTGRKLLVLVVSCLLPTVGPEPCRNV